MTTPNTNLVQLSSGRRCRRVGRTHFYKGVNFEQANWTLFKKIALDTIVPGQAENELDTNVSVIMGRLFDWIVAQMHAGFMAETIDNFQDDCDEWSEFAG